MNPSEPRFSYLLNGDAPLSRSLGERNETMLSTGPGVGTHRILVPYYCKCSSLVSLVLESCNAVLTALSLLTRPFTHLEYTEFSLTQGRLGDE